MNARTARGRFLLSLLGLILILSPVRPAAVDQAQVDALLAEARRAWGVPGLAAAIVQDDQVVYLKGSGVRTQGGTDPVTPDTLFGIGSCTKAFTATAWGLLVEEGKANWDDPVRKHVPFFRLADPLADRDVTLRDLLCHRTGLARHDLLWYRAPWSLEESVRRLAFLQPDHSFRSAYAYNNLAYITAGLAIASASGRPWHEYVRQRLFDPLGMKGAVFTRSAVLKVPDHASPHRLTEAGKVEVIPWYDDDRQVRASGAIKAGVRDLSYWVRLQLNDGVLEGKRVVPAAVLEETHAPQVVVPLDREEARASGTTQESYGLGWHVSDYHGHHLLSHSGAVDGFRARILLLPRERTGIVLLANLAESRAVLAAANTLLDHILGLPARDWHAHYAEERQHKEVEERGREARRLASRHPGTRPSRDLRAYTGTYREPAYGRVRIDLEDRELVLCWSSFRVPLRHFHFDTFRAEAKEGSPGERLAREFAVFTLDADGDVDTLRFLGRTFTRADRKRSEAPRQ